MLEDRLLAAIFDAHAKGDDLHDAARLAASQVGATDQQLMNSIDLLAEARLIEATTQRGGDGRVRMAVVRTLTWRGREEELRRRSR